MKDFKNSFFAEKKHNLIIVHIDKDVKDEEIDLMIVSMHPTIMQAQQGFVCAIFGYDQDERELYNIPEVANLCQRLVDRGLISLMHVSTLVDAKEKPFFKPFFGAMEVWAIAKKLFTPGGDLEIDQARFAEFLEDLSKANKKGLELYNSPRLAPEGQNRTTI